MKQIIKTALVKLIDVVLAIMALVIALVIAHYAAAYSVTVSSRVLENTVHNAAMLGGVDLFNYTFTVAIMSACVTASLLATRRIYLLLQCVRRKVVGLLKTLAANRKEKGVETE